MTAQAPHLAIHVHLLDDRWHGLPEWPPAPFRLFQALVAAAAQGERISEQDADALRWLEAQPVPLILAPYETRGTKAQIYVPNNDLDAVNGNPDRIGEIRTSLKIVHPRLFTRLPAFTYVWREAAAAIPNETWHTLQSIVHRLYQFGRGVDMAFASIERIDDTQLEDLASQPDMLRFEPKEAGHDNLLPVPEPGSLESLLERFRANRQRLQAEQQGRRRVVWHFRQPPKPRARNVCYACPSHMRLYELRSADDEAAFAPWPRTDVVTLVKKLRDAAAQRLENALPGKREDIARYLVGRNAGKHDKDRRIRIIPLPSIGHAYAGGAIRRVLVEVPQGCPLSPEDIFWAFNGLSPEEEVDWETGEIVTEARTRLVAATDTIFPTRHYRIGNWGNFPPEIRWRTVTPAALPVKRGGRTGSARLMHETHAIHAVKQALRHAGVNARLVRIHVQREPFDRNAARADRYGPRRDPDLAQRFRPGHLWHVDITFDRPIRGPLIIGDGRYLGLGLMAPVPTWARTEEGEPRDAFLFRLPGDGLPARDMETVLKYLRGALMRLDGKTHDRDKTCLLFSGHEETSSKPARPGAHLHVFLAAPPDERDRIREVFVIPPWLADNHPDARKVRRERARHFANVLSRLRVLFGPDLPHTPLTAASPSETERHPLLVTARIWQSATPIISTRHYRASRDGEPKEFLAEDIRRELARRHLPRGEHIPSQRPLPEIEILSIALTPDSRVRGDARLTFHAPVPGPFLLGWGCHRGQGVFVTQIGL